MEIDVTVFVEDLDCSKYSASCAELGDIAPQVTWWNSLERAAKAPLVVGANAEIEVLAWFLSFGAWSRDELCTMSTTELNAILIQYVASEVRDYQKTGQMNNLYRGDDNHWYLHVGI